MPHLIAPSGHHLDLPARHLTFGESPACDIPLQGDYGLTPLHFELAPGSDGLTYLRDASGGLTRVNGQPVATTVLWEGDLIEAGKLSLRFGGSTAAPVSVPVPKEVVSSGLEGSGAPESVVEIPLVVPAPPP